MQNNQPLDALSPLDGRYASITAPLRDYFSESALIKYRVEIEIKYLLALSDIGLVPKIHPPDTINVERIKAIEVKTHHDVKAVEYYLREVLPPSVIPFTHFALTSEDINNLAYRLMLRDALKSVIAPQLKSIISHLGSLIKTNAGLPMLARTHGQPAIPTTFGKEMAVFGSRLLSQLSPPQLTGKLNGAVGNYSAHLVANPQTDWIKFSDDFITSLGLLPNHITTQINSADDLIQLLQKYQLINSILIDLCQDIWRYISDEWLIQKGKDQDVGSSTMPQKINPIEFENAEGNLTLANGVIETLNRKLPISRLQRDLSDSTLMRNLGIIFGYISVALHSLNTGLKTLEPNPKTINQDLNANYAILGEALQTYLRQKGQVDAYETVAAQFKHKDLSQLDWQNLVQDLAPELIHLTPDTYIGYAEKLALTVAANINKYV